MPLVDLPLVKKHLRVTWTDEDTEITLYRDAAEVTVSEYLDRCVLPEGDELPTEEDESYDPHTMNVTPPIVAAILLQTGEFYERRETPEKNEGEAMLSPVVRRLLAPYRVWRSNVESDD